MRNDYLDFEDIGEKICGDYETRYETDEEIRDRRKQNNLAQDKYRNKAKAGKPVKAKRPLKRIRSNPR